MAPASDQLLFALSQSLASTLTTYLLVAMTLVGLGRMHARSVVAGALAFTALSVAGAALCVTFDVVSYYVTFPLFAASIVIFWRVSNLSWGRTAFVCLTAALVATYASFWAALVDGIVVADTLSLKYLAWPGMATQWALSVPLVAVLQWPARRILPEMLQSRAIAHPGSHFWRIAWLIPFSFFTTLYILTPEETVTAGQTDAILSLVELLALTAVLAVVVYVILWSLVDTAERSLEDADRLRQRETQTMFAEHLEERMRSARHANHNLRQYVTALEGYAERGDLEGFRGYVSRLHRELPAESTLAYCGNPAVNAVMLYYCDRVRALGVEPDVAMRVPSRLAFSDVELTALFGNLMENAVEALEAAVADGSSPALLTLRVRATYEAGMPLVVTVDNSSPHSPVYKKDGGLVSTKREGEATGTESVRAIARRHGGDARFEWEAGVFRASVVLMQPR